METKALDCYRSDEGTYVVEEYAKIIARKKYSTLTAEFMDGAWDFTDDHYSGVYYSLFRKKTGELFSYVAWYRYYQKWNDIDRQHCVKQEIKPLTEEEGKDFCEAHFGVETYEKLFGEADE